MLTESAVPMRPKEGERVPPWYRLDRDIAHVGLGFLRQVFQLLGTDIAPRTSLGYAAQQLEVTFDDSGEAAKVLATAIAERWFKVEDGSTAETLSIGEERRGQALRAAYADFDAAMVAAGWYDLPLRSRAIVHAALGELMLPFIFHCLRSETRLDDNVPTTEALSKLFVHNQKTEKGPPWSTRFWRNLFELCGRRRKSSLSTSKPPASE